MAEQKAMEPQCNTGRSPMRLLSFFQGLAGWAVVALLANRALLLAFCGGAPEIKWFRMFGPVLFPMAVFCVLFLLRLFLLMRRESREGPVRTVWGHMEHFPCEANAKYAAFLLLYQLLWVTMAVLGFSYAYVALVYFDMRFSSQMELFRCSILLLPAAFAAHIVRNFLMAGKPPAWVYVMFCATALLAIVVSHAWFMTEVMHDLSIAYGGHGRWGCLVIDADGHCPLWFYDRTAVWIIYPPLVAATFLHWGFVRRNNER